MPEDFKVRVGEFEGPLELLLELIEKRKLHISDVSLSSVADEFIEYVKELEESDDKKHLSDLADFILVASTLLLIKSKSLLPNMELSTEEEVSIEDLENRLIAYKKYRELSLGIGKMFGNFLFFAKERKNNLVVFAPTTEITFETLKNSLEEVLNNIPKKIEKLPEVMVEKIVSLEEMVNKLSERIKTSLRTSFSDFSGMKNIKNEKEHRAQKVNVIVSFLAMLELVKQGAVRVNQDKHFDDISIETENTGVPTYY